MHIIYAVRPNSQKVNIMANNIFVPKRNVDVVFCIDGTGSMAPCIESIKANVHRDYHFDGEQAMSESPFFEFPADTADMA